MTREQGLVEELAFWGRVMLDGGGWPEEWKAGFDPELPLQDKFRALLANHSVGDTVDILDVGAGPATVVGRTWPGRDVLITPIDPLAVEYGKLLASHGFNPPVQTIKCAGEGIEGLLPKNFYDVAYARNSLDHSEYPVEIIRQMLEAAKPGGWVYLEHSVREATKQKYLGLHQWNFFEEKGVFYIEGSGGTTNVSLKFENLTCYAEAWMEKDNDGRDWVLVKMRRRP
jgi:SAM-dependent methyltransferase